LRLHGIAVHQGVELTRASGGDRVQAMHWRKAGREHHIDCDGVGFGYALRPETQLPDLLGCRFRYDKLQRGALPERDAAGRSSVAGVYLAATAPASWAPMRPSGRVSVPLWRCWPMQERRLMRRARHRLKTAWQALPRFARGWSVPFLSRQLGCGCTG
jgi:hypothetical protein